MPWKSWITGVACHWEDVKSWVSSQIGLKGKWKNMWQWLDRAWITLHNTLLSTYFRSGNAVKSVSLEIIRALNILSPNFLLFLLHLLRGVTTTYSSAQFSDSFHCLGWSNKDYLVSNSTKTTWAPSLKHFQWTLVLEGLTKKKKNRVYMPCISVNSLLIYR